jgi:transposase-like protein
MEVVFASLGLLLLLLFLFTLLGKNSKYSDFGINLKRVYCPKCNTKQPIVRKPNNQRQALFGGYTCKKCGAEMDKFGTEIKD